MQKAQYIRQSFIYALATALYTAGVAWFLFHAEQLFGNTPGFLIPLFLLLLFIISACITSLLVLGKSVHLYLTGHKREGFIFLFSTLGWLIGFAVIVAVILAMT